MITVTREKCIAMQLPESILLLASRYLSSLEHEQQVAQLALMLFNELLPLHGLHEDERLLLRCAALLHDIGWVYGQSEHHKSAQRLILETPLPPFDRRQQTIIALVARYHRKALPQLKHQHYAKLSSADKRLVLVLGGIVRLADGLDRTHRSLVYELHCEIKPKEIAITCAGEGHANEECAIALEKSDLLQQAFLRSVTIRMK